MPSPRTLAIWGILTGLIGWALFEAATSPLLQWREPIYIGAAFAGVIGMALLLIQPLLAAGLFPGLTPVHARRLHRWCGAALVTALIVHVVGLWITSPPDVIDALTFTSPTPFAPWGVIAMWAAFGAAGLAVYRRRFKLHQWRLGHSALVAIVAIGTVIHAFLIDGTMGTVSKTVLALACLGALALAVRRMKPWSLLRKRRAGS